MIGYVRWLRRLNAVRQARVLPPVAVAAISQQVGPPPVAIRAVVRGCQVVAAALGVLAALLLVATDWRNPLEVGLAPMLAAALVLLGAGYVVSGRRVDRQGEPNSLYGLTVALCLITSGALVYGIQHLDPHRWGEVLGYAVGTVALAALGCLPFAGASARWLNNYRAAAAAYRLAHRPVPSASPEREPAVFTSQHISHGNDHHRQHAVGPRQRMRGSLANPTSGPVRPSRAAGPVRRSGRPFKPGVVHDLLRANRADGQAGAVAAGGQSDTPVASFDCGRCPSRPVPMSWIRRPTKAAPGKRSNARRGP